MTGHLLRAELSPSGSVDVKLIERPQRSASLVIDISYEGSDYALAVLRILERFIGDARSYEDVTMRVPCHAAELMRPLLDDLAELLSARGREIEGFDLRLLLSPVRHESSVVQWVGGSFRALPRSEVVRVREIELSALIEHYGALHDEKDVQFVLPSGGIASEFLRMGDVLRTQRDCRVVALWVLDAFSGVLRDSSHDAPLNLLVDTPSLLPICYEIWSLTARSASPYGRITVAPSYPHAGGEVDSLIRDSLASANLLLCLISASSSGTMTSLFARSLARVVGRQRGTVVVLGSVGSRSPLVDTVGVPVLCHVGGGEKERHAAPLHTIRVEPSTMAFFPWEEGDGVPTVTPPADTVQASWLSVLAANDAVAVECLPHSGRGLVRPRSGLMAFRLLPDRLAENVRDLVPLLSSIDISALQGEERTIVVLPDDLAMEDGGENILTLLQALGIGVQGIEPLGEYLNQEPSGRALCFAWGSVTGHSAAALVREVRRLHGGPVDLFLVYFRPPAANDLGLLEAAVGEGSLVIGWQAVVPWTSAFEPEALLLTDFLDSVAPHTTSELHSEILARMDLISPIGSAQDWDYRRARLGRAAAQILWCDRIASDTEWQSHTPVVLLGAAAELARLRSEFGSRFRLNLRAVLSATPDPRWFAALLRQAERGEIVYWNTSADRPESVEAVASWMLEEREDSDYLLAEFLCADALGKVPDDLAFRLVPEIRTRVEQGLFAASHESSMRLLLAINDWSRGTLA